MGRWKKGDKVKHPNLNPNILEGLPSIGNFLGKSPNTVVNWIMNHGLPATKTPNGRWLTHTQLILQWMYAGHEAELKARGVGGRSKEDIQILATRMGIGKEWREFIGDRLDS